MQNKNHYIFFKSKKQYVGVYKNWLQRQHAKSIGYLVRSYISFILQLLSHSSFLPSSPSASPIPSPLVVLYSTFFSSPTLSSVGCVHVASRMNQPIVRVAYMRCKKGGRGDSGPSLSFERPRGLVATQSRAWKEKADC